MQIEHNQYRWRVAKNCHPNTDGTDWGWIEGASNVCWSNRPFSRLTRSQAEELVAQHNDWLDKQTPVVVRLLKAKEQAAKIEKEVVEAEAQVERLRSKLRVAVAEIAALQKVVG